VDVIRRHDLVQYAEAKALPRLEQPVLPLLLVAAKFEQKLALMTAVGDMPDVTGSKKRFARGIPFPFP